MWSQTGAACCCAAGAASHPGVGKLGRRWRSVLPRAFGACRSRGLQGSARGVTLHWGWALHGPYSLAARQCALGGGG